MPIVNKFSLTRARMPAFLDGLEQQDAAALTLYLPPGLSPQQCQEYLPPTEALEGSPTPPELVCGSRTGAAVFWGKSQKYLILPPFPVGEKRIEPGTVTSPLKDLLSRDFKVALVLIRLGAYAIGLCRGEELIASKVGTGNIHGRHKQGGSSSNRFRRHREKQIETFLVRVCGHIQEVLGPEARSIDHIVYGGSNTATLLLRKSCDLLRRFDGRELPPLFDWQEPRQYVLESAVTRLWSSTVFEWEDPAPV